jgi:hypothetical protein
MRKFIAFMILILLGIATYYYTGNQFEDKDNNVEILRSNKLTKNNILVIAKEDYYNLLRRIRQLQKTPDQILKFNNMIMELMYSGNLEKEDVALLAAIQREYYSYILLKRNPLNIHVEKLQKEVEDYNAKKTKIIGHKVLTSPEYIGVNKNRAIIKVLFYLNNTESGSDVYEQYFLEQNKDDLWEIVGWTSLDEHIITEEY